VAVTDSGPSQHPDRDEIRKMQARIMQGAGPVTDPGETSTFDLNTMPERANGDPANPSLWLQALVNPAETGCSLQAVRYPPGGTVALHRHDVPQVVFVVEGELRQGNRVFKAGSGYYTPANQAYTITAGPEGVKVIEFRDVPLSFESDFSAAQERAAAREKR
jgi:quercetin dioxygenase-like cupin family protein